MVMLSDAFIKPWCVLRPRLEWDLQILQENPSVRRLDFQDYMKFIRIAGLLKATVRCLFEGHVSMEDLKTKA